MIPHCFRFFLLLFCYPFVLHAQEHKQPVFGAPTPQELSMTVYEKDSSAQAVVLFDFLNIGFKLEDGRFRVQLERHLRIKILGKEGYGAAAMAIRVYRGDGIERLERITGSTYYQEGSEVVARKLDDRQVFRQLDGAYVTYKFAMPGVREGSVLDVEYMLTSSHLGDLQPWEYQQEYPVMHGVCQVEIPQELTYGFRHQGMHPFFSESREVKPRHYMQGSNKFSTNAVYGRWEVRDVPALRQEPFMAPLSKVRGRMDFQLRYLQEKGEARYPVAENWQVLEERVLLDRPTFGAYLRGHKSLEAWAESLAGGSTDTVERVLRASESVRQRVAWNRQRGALASASIGRVLEEGQGNAAAQNLLLVALLREMGIQAWPLLTSNRDAPPLDSAFASIHGIRETLALVRRGGGESSSFMVVDVSDPLLPPGLPPRRCLNGMGWVCSKGMHAWREVVASRPTVHRIAASFGIAPDGSLKGQVDRSWDGYAAYEIRSGGPVTEAIADALEPHVGSISDLKVTNEGDVHKPLRLQYALEIDPSEKVLLTSKTLDLQPMLSYMEHIDVFKLPERAYAIELDAPLHYYYSMTFQLPEGYRLTGASQAPVGFALPDRAARASYRLQQEGNILSVSWQLQLNKTRYTPAEYAALREFAIRVSAKLQEMVSLQKVGQ